MVRQLSYGLFLHFHSDVDIHRHDARDTRFGHGHADQLLRHFHGDLIVCDEQKLGVLRHFLDQLAIAFGIRIVQRRVHLVQQTKWCGVEAEQRKYQRQGGERLFATGQWEDVINGRDRAEYSVLYGALQLADRTGALTTDQLIQFSGQVQQAAENLMAVAQMPERQVAMETAAKLDEFCAEVDILVGINVIALDQDTFAGTKIRALAEAGGFKLHEEGTYEYQDEHGVVLYTLTNQESAPFQIQEMKYLTTHGLTMLFDVPRIPHGLRAFDHMILFARQLADSLKGMLVDDNLRPLTDDGIAKIKQQISLIYAKMDKHGIAAGSARAQRLFS